MNYAYVPAQEIILVCVFVIYLHLQFLTRHFMDYNLMYQTHTQGHVYGNSDLYGSWLWPHVTMNENSLIP